MNPWIILDEADIVLSVPFTSMSEGGLALGKLSAYFDPLASLRPRLGDQVPFLSGSDQLHQWLCDAKLKLQDRDKIQNFSNMGPVRIGAAFKEILLEH